MGSFNVATNLSRMSVSVGDKVILFPIVKHEYSMPLVGVSLGGMQGATSYMTPLTAPIRATYDDYGYFVDIVKDCTTEAIEKEFGISIEHFLGIITLEHKIEHVFSDLEKDSPEYIEKRDYFYNIGLMIEHVDIYETLLQSRLDNKKSYDSDFHKMLLENKEDYLIKKALIKKALNKKFIADMQESETSTDEEVADKLYKIKETMAILYKKISCFDSLTTPKELTDMFFNSDSPDIVKAYSDLAEWNMVMYTQNCFYVPAMNGLQHGSVKGEILLHETALELAKKKLQKYLDNDWDMENIE